MVDGWYSGATRSVLLIDRDKKSPLSCAKSQVPEGQYSYQKPLLQAKNIRTSSLPSPMTECPVLEQLILALYPRFINEFANGAARAMQSEGLHHMARRTLNLATLFIAATAFAYAGHHPKIAADLEGRDPGSVVDVIIQYKQGAQQKHVDAVSRKGGFHKGNLDIVKGSVFSVPATALEELANDPDVEFISPDRRLRGTGSILPIDYFRETVHADSAINSGWDGTGIGVAVIDSGITTGGDLDSPAYSRSFVSGDSSTGDAYGHGTHVAGIIAGSGNYSSGEDSDYTFGGAAPGVSIINLRALDGNGAGTDSSVINAIQKAIALKNFYNIRVINLSLGRPVTTSYVNDPLCQAVEAAWKAGIIVVVAAGNEGRNNTAGTTGYGTILAPGNDPYVITVGAMKSMGTASRNDDQIASYSSKGPTLIDHIVKPDLVAPGNQVLSVEAPSSLLASQFPTNELSSTVFWEQYSPWREHRYFMLSGTSMATPVVSSAVASLLQKTPWLTPDQVKARLMKTASKAFPVSSAAIDPATGINYTSYYDIFTVGAGYLDTSAALANHDFALGSALSPTATYNAATNTAMLSVHGAGIIWGTGVNWGTGIIWGTNALLSGTNVIWGTGVIWGTCTPDGLSVIWGTTSMAATSLIWGSDTASATTLARGE